MPKATDKRERLLTTALRKIHQQGFAPTTLADIAEAAKVPLGNVYYYFKTKQAIAEAIIDRRQQYYAKQRSDWERLPDAKSRLLAFIDMTLVHQRELVKSGCPIGTLCTELQKGGKSVAGGQLAQRASSLFSEFLVWLELQFSELGRGAEAEGLAIQLLSSLEGATLLSHSFRSSDFIVRETARLKQWVSQL